MDPVNPYQAFNQPSDSPITPQSGIRRSVLTHIRVISILMIVHGIMLVLVGVLYVGMAFVMPSFVLAQNQQMKQASGGPSPEQMNTILLVTYGLMGAAGFLPGILQIFAGLSNLRLKNRILGLFALLGGLVAVATCYCLPTAVALGVYGLVIYFNESAVKAFALAADGMTVEQIDQLAN